jgi:SAM-dependent methyltransferase
MLNQHPQPAQVNFSEAYEKQLVPALFLPAAQILLEHAQPQPDERVLDVACGTGIVARLTAPAVGERGSVTALDISPPMLVVARGLPQPDGAKIDWRDGSALSLPFTDASFDLVLCQQGLQFFPDQLTALREMRRVLKPGGRVLVAVQQGLEQNPIYREFNAALVRHLGMPALAAPFSMGDAGQLERLLTDAGFTRIEVLPISHPVRFESAQVFIAISMFASAAAVTALSTLDEGVRAGLVEKIGQELRETLARYEENGTLVFPMAALIVRGYT